MEQCYLTKHITGSSFQGGFAPVVLPCCGRGFSKLGYLISSIKDAVGICLDVKFLIIINATLNSFRVDGLVVK